MRALLCLLIFGAVCSSFVSARKNWALLIAGSNTYGNYRHQADICHAYQIMHKAGIPDEQIVVMMYDDIANNRENPFPGNIINHVNGTNVYPGVLKDYTGKDVNAKMFLAVLQGQKDVVRELLGGREGKVIDSGPDDYIFVNFADHGAPGILGMPTLPYLKARDVNTALQSMYDKKRFAKLTFYVEACESGSIFNKLLPKDINVYATTAANPNESSWGCYWDQSREAYLGDTYSVKWMEDTDAADLHTETFLVQYEHVKKLTTKSHVQQYGDLSIDKFMLEKFYGNDKVFVGGPKPTAPVDQVPSEMVTYKTLKNKIERAPANSERKASLEAQLVALEKTMLNTHDLIWDIARTTVNELPEKRVYDLVMKHHEDINDWDCYETVVDTLLDVCPGLDITKNDFALRKFYVLVNLCNHRPTGKIISALETASTVNPICRLV